MKQNLSLAICSLIFCFVVAETVLRIISPKSPPGTTYGKVIKLNSDGYRDKEFVIPKPKNKYRILFLGDSYTWGIGLDLIDILPKQLEQVLKKDFNNIEIVNAAEPGSNTVEQLIRLKQSGLKYEPNLVVLVYDLNDIEFKSEIAINKDGVSDSDRYTLNYYGRNFDIREIIARFQEYSYFVNFLVPRIGAILRKAGMDSLELSGVQRMFQGFIDTNPGWIESKMALRELSNVCKDNGIKFMVVIYPLLVDLDNYEGYKAHKAIADYCNSLDVPVIDLINIFKNKKVVKLQINYMDGHPNKEAHKLVVSKILPIIKNHLPSTLCRRQVKIK